MSATGREDGAESTAMPGVQEATTSHKALPPDTATTALSPRQESGQGAAASSGQASGDPSHGHARPSVSAASPEPTGPAGLAGSAGRGSALHREPHQLAVLGTQPSQDQHRPAATAPTPTAQPPSPAPRDAASTRSQERQTVRNDLTLITQGSPPTFTTAARVDPTRPMKVRAVLAAILKTPKTFSVRLARLVNALDKSSCDDELFTCLAQVLFEARSPKKVLDHVLLFTGLRPEYILSVIQLTGIPAWMLRTGLALGAWRSNMPVGMHAVNASGQRKYDAVQTTITGRPLGGDLPHGLAYRLGGNLSGPQDVVLEDARRCFEVILTTRKECPADCAASTRYISVLTDNQALNGRLFDRYGENTDLVRVVWDEQGSMWLTRLCTPGVYVGGGPRKYDRIHREGKFSSAVDMSRLANFARRTLTKPHHFHNESLKRRIKDLSSVLICFLAKPVHTKRPHPSPSPAAGGTPTALTGSAAAGGSSTTPTPHLQQALAHAVDTEGLLSYIVLQNPYTLVLLTRKRERVMASFKENTVAHVRYHLPTSVVSQRYTEVDRDGPPQHGPAAYSGLGCTPLDVVSTWARDDVPDGSTASEGTVPVLVADSWRTKGSLPREVADWSVSPPPIGPLAPAAPALAPAAAGGPSNGASVFLMSRGHCFAALFVESVEDLTTIEFVACDGSSDERPASLSPGPTPGLVRIAVPQRRTAGAGGLPAGPLMTVQISRSSGTMKSTAAPGVLVGQLRDLRLIAPQLWRVSEYREDLQSLLAVPFDFRAAAHVECAFELARQTLVLDRADNEPGNPQHFDPRTADCYVHVQPHMAVNEFYRLQHHTFRKFRLQDHVKRLSLASGDGGRNVVGLDLVTPGLDGVLSESINQLIELGHMHSQRGLHAYAGGRYTQAIECHKLHHQAAKVMHDLSSVGVALGNQGNAFLGMGEYDKAIKCHQRHSEICRSTLDDVAQASACGNLAVAYCAKGEYDNAMQLHNTQLDICHNITYDLAGEGKARGGLGNVHFSLNQLDKAVEFHLRHAEICASLGDEVGRSAALCRVGNSYAGMRGKGKLDQAEQYYLEYHEMCRRTGDLVGQSKATGLLGVVYTRKRDYEGALRMHTRLYSWYKRNDDVHGMAMSRGNIGVVHQLQGRLTEALTSLGEACNLFERTGDASNAAEAKCNLANTLHDLAALEYAAIAAERKELARQREREGAADDEHDALVSELAQREGRADRLNERAARLVLAAIGTFELIRSSSSSRHTQIRLQEYQSSPYATLQLIYLGLRRPWEAFAVAERARAQALTSSMSETHRSRGLRSKWTGPAHARAQAVAVATNKTVLYFSLVPARALPGETPSQQDDHGSGAEAGAGASRRATSPGGGRASSGADLGPSPDAPGSIAAPGSPPRSDPVDGDDSGDAVMDVEPEPAHKAAPSAGLTTAMDKAKDNTDTHPTAKSPEQMQGVEEKSKEKEAEAEAAANDYHLLTWVFPAKPDQAPVFVDQRISMLGLVELVNATRRELRVPTQSILPPDLKAHLSKYGLLEHKEWLADKMLCTDYDTFENMLKALIEAPNHLEDMINESKPKPANLDGLRAGIRMAKEERRRLVEPLRALYDLLIRPVAGALPASPLNAEGEGVDDAPAIVVMPHSALYMVPFGALQVDSASRTFLIEHFVLTSCPSLRLLDYTHTLAAAQDHDEPPASQALTVGASEPCTGVGKRRYEALPGAAEEARAIEKLYGARCLTGKDATVRAVLKGLKGSAIIHLAAHGIPDPNAPDWGLNGGLLLKDGVLPAEGIAQDKLYSARCAILSACSTGDGRLMMNNSLVIPNEGVMGLARAFFLAGVPASVVSLWTLDDHVSTIVMSAFYQELRSQPLPVALRRASLRLLYDKRERWLREPRHWAAYSIVGCPNENFRIRVRPGSPRAVALEAAASGAKDEAVGVEVEVAAAAAAPMAGVQQGGGTPTATPKPAGKSGGSLLTRDPDATMATGAAAGAAVEPDPSVQAVTSMLSSFDISAQDASAVAVSAAGQLARGFKSGDVLLSAAGGSGFVRLQARPSSAAVMCLALASQGRLLASGHSDGAVQVWDTQSPAGPAVLDAGRGAGRSRVVLGVAFSPDARLLASGSSDGLIQLWDLAAQPPAGVSVLGHADAVGCLAFSPDGRRLVTGSHDGTIRLWDVAARGLRTASEPLQGHGGWVNGVAFSPDGRLIASGFEDETVQIWSVERQAPVATLAGHSGRVLSVAFSPDGARLASGSLDRTCRLWDVTTHAPLGRPLTGHKSEVQSVAFGPDPQRLVSASIESLLIAWDPDGRQIPPSGFG